MQESENKNTIISTYFEICKKLRDCRNDSKATIDVVANLLKVDRRKIIDLENCNRIDLELFSEYCYLYGIDLKLKYELH